MGTHSTLRFNQSKPLCRSPNLVHATANGSLVLERTTRPPARAPVARRPCDTAHDPRHSAGDPAHPGRAADDGGTGWISGRAAGADVRDCSGAGIAAGSTA